MSHTIGQQWIFPLKSCLPLAVLETQSKCMLIFVHLILLWIILCNNSIQQGTGGGKK